MSHADLPKHIVEKFDVAGLRTWLKKPPSGATTKPGLRRTARLSAEKAVSSRSPSSGSRRETGSPGLRARIAVASAAPIHAARHHNVAHHEIEIRMLEHLERGRCAGHRTGLIAKLSEHRDAYRQHFGIVLHDQQCSADRALFLTFVRTARGISFGSGQIDCDRRPASHLAFDMHRAARLMRKAVHLRKTEAASLANLLGREKRIKNLG